MLYLGLDLSRKRLDWHALRADGSTQSAGSCPPDADGLRQFARGFPQLVIAAIESMAGARFVHDQLEEFGWEVLVADAAKAKGLAPLTCKTDKIDAFVLAQLCRLDLVPEIWLPSLEVRGARERARFRLQLVQQRTRLKNRIHAALIQFGLPRPVKSLFSMTGRCWLSEAPLPQPWKGHVEASLELIGVLDDEIAAIERELRRLGKDDPYVPLLMTLPGVHWVLGYTIAAETGAIERFPSPKQYVSHTGLCPRVYQSGETLHYGRLAKHGPAYLRWAWSEAARTAAHHPYFQPTYKQIKKRLGRSRGTSAALLTIARKEAEAAWYMLTRKQPFAPAGAVQVPAR